MIAPSETLVPWSTMKCRSKCWLPFVIGTLFMTLAFAIIYVYLVMRHITTSTEHFEGLPSYAESIFFFICGTFVFLMLHPAVKERGKTVKCGSAFMILTTMLSLISITLSLCIIDRHDRYAICHLRDKQRMCQCKERNESDDGSAVAPPAVGRWYYYHNVDNCLVLDTLFRCMVIHVGLCCFGAILCIVTLALLWFLWRCIPVPFVDENRRDERPSRDYASVPSMPVSDWDAWLFSTPLFSRIIADWRSRFPPSYEASQAMRNRGPSEATAHENPPRIMLPRRQTSTGPSGLVASTGVPFSLGICTRFPRWTTRVVQPPTADEPPPPYREHEQSSSTASSSRRTSFQSLRVFSVAIDSSRAATPVGDQKDEPPLEADEQKI